MEEDSGNLNLKDIIEPRPLSPKNSRTGSGAKLTRKTPPLSPGRVTLPASGPMTVMPGTQAWSTQHPAPPTSLMTSQLHQQPSSVSIAAAPHRPPQIIGRPPPPQPPTKADGVARVGNPLQEFMTCMPGAPIIARGPGANRASASPAATYGAAAPKRQQPSATAAPTTTMTVSASSGGATTSATSTNANTAAQFFMQASSPQNEAQMWALQRQLEAGSASANQKISEEAKENLIKAVKTFAARSQSVLPSELLNSLVILAMGANHSKLALTLLNAAMTHDLTPAISPSVSPHFLPILEILVTNSLSLELTARLFEVIITDSAFSVSSGRVLDDDCPVHMQLLNVLCSSEGLEDHATQLIRSSILCTYRKFPPLRQKILTSITSQLSAFGWGKHTHYAPISDLLHILVPIIAGLQQPIRTEHDSILCEVLAPLHRPTIALDELTTVMSTYYRPLSLCIRMFMRKLEPDRHFKLASSFLKRVLSCVHLSDTKHSLILLNSIQEILEEIDGEVFDSLYRPILKLLADCTISEHAALAQRALQFWRSEAFMALVRRQEEPAITSMMPALIRDAKAHWNDGINNLICVVLDLLMSMSESARQTCMDVAVQHILTHCADLLLGSEQEDAQKRQDAAMRIFNEFVAAVRKRQHLRDEEERERTILKKQRQDEYRTKTLPPTVNHLKFVFGKELGAGSYSRVVQAKYIEIEVKQSLWLDYAIKIMDKHHVEQQNYLQQVEQEVSVLRALDHPGISHLYAYFNDAHRIYIVLEFCPLGDLFSAVFESGSTVTVEWLRFCLCELIAVLNHIHNAGFYYGDLKPENILLTESGHIRLCDFGSCKSTQQLEEMEEQLLLLGGQQHHLTPTVSSERERAGPVDGNTTEGAGTQDQQAGSKGFPATVEASASSAIPTQAEIFAKLFSGTAEYLAPEIPNGHRVTPSADYWALGCIAYQLLVGHVPFFADTRADLFYKIQSRDFSYPNGFATRFPQLHELIEALLCSDPSKRYGYWQLRSHAFFKDYNIDSIFDVASPPLLSLRPATGSAVGGDSKWRRRKFSMMWNPLPTATEAEHIHASLNDAISEIVEPSRLDWPFYETTAAQGKQ